MGTMRHTRSSSATKHDGYGPSTSTRGQTRQDHHLGVGRAGSVLDSPRVARRPGGPSMTGDRFLLLVSQLLGRASHLWDREEQELKRGAELMVISCTPPEPTPLPPPPPPPPPPLPVSAPGPVLPDGLPCTPRFGAAALHANAHHSTLNSPALLPPGALTLSSPSWSDFGGLNFGLPLHGAIGIDVDVDGPDGLGVGRSSQQNPGAAGATAAAGTGDQELPGTHQQPQQGQPAPAVHALDNPWGLLGLGHGCDAEAFITLPGGIALGVGCSSARAKLKTCDSGGPPSARLVLGPDAFTAQLCATTADDLLGSPFGPGIFNLDTFR